VTAVRLLVVDETFLDRLLLDEAMLQTPDVAISGVLGSLGQLGVFLSTHRSQDSPDIAAVGRTLRDGPGKDAVRMIATGSPRTRVAMMPSPSTPARLTALVAKLLTA
jgi:hypothetical protein